MRYRLNYFFVTYPFGQCDLSLTNSFRRAHHSWFSNQNMTYVYSYYELTF